DRCGEQHDVLAVAAAAIPFHRRAEAPERIFRPAVSRGPLTFAAGVRDIGAVLDREGRRASGGVPARGPWLPAVFGDAVRDTKNACGAPRCARAIHPSIRGRLEKLSRESGAG